MLPEVPAADRVRRTLPVQGTDILPLRPGPAPEGGVAGTSTCGGCREEDRTEGLTVRIVKHLFTNLYTLCYEVVCLFQEQKKLAMEILKDNLFYFSAKKGHA